MIATRILAVLAACAALSPIPAFAQTPQTSLPDIEDEVMCPICGTPLEHSNAPQAERERALIRRLIEQGRSKEEIKDALVAEYGPEVLAVPGDDGFDLAAWLVPALGLVAALAFVGIALARVRRTREPAAADPIEPSEAAKLAEDMARYEP